MDYQLYKNIMTHDERRGAFDKLAVQTFHLSFENWYQTGYWAETNMPYTLFDGEKAVSNVSVNRMEILWNDNIYHWIQLGTVMTDKEYRNLGLSRFLIEEILKDWSGRCDGFFLFANKKVLDFYPKFGFEKQAQYQPSLAIDTYIGDASKLNMDLAADREFLKKYYQKTNPFSRLQSIHNFSLLMFYCTSVMKDFVYYSPSCDAIMIAEKNGGELHCYDIFCDAGKNLKDVVCSMATEEIKTVTFYFTPNDNHNYILSEATTDMDTLFVRSDKESIFVSNKLMFPEISHT